MKTKYLLLIFVIIGFSCTKQKNSLPSTSNKEVIKKLNLNNSFVKNNGNSPDTVLYTAKVKSGTISLSRNGFLHYKLQSKNGNTFEFSEQITNKTPNPLPLDTIVVNYMKGKRENWHKELKHGNLYLGEVFKGIELGLACNDNNVEKLFTVKAGNSPENIQLSFTGLDSIKTNIKNELMLYKNGDSLAFEAPKAFLKADKTKYYDAGYSVNGLSYGFSVPAYNGKEDLIIDPLIACTLLGGAHGYETVKKVYEEDDGSYLIIGTTDSDDFPVVGNSFDNSFNSIYGTDVFFARMDSNLDNLLTATYFGGNWTERLNDVIRDNNGNILICGATGSNDLPVSENAWSSFLHNDYFTGYISIISKELDEVIASTYGTERTRFDNILLLNENIYVAGFILDSNEATYNFTSDVYCDTVLGDKDIFVLKFNQELSKRITGTYIGTIGYDKVTGLFHHSDSTIGIMGIIGDTLKAEHEPFFEYQGNRDAFVGVLDTGLTRMIYFTPFGGSTSWEEPYKIKEWDNGDYFISGVTKSSDFPLIPDSLTNISYLRMTGFLLSFNHNFSKCYFSNLNWLYPTNPLWINRNSYYLVGGTHIDTLPGIDSNSFSTDFYGYADSNSFGLSYHYDGYIAKITDTMQIKVAHATYFGGIGDEWVNWEEQLLNSKKEVVFFGSTASNSLFPFTTHGYDTTYNGGYDYQWVDQGDAFIAILDSNLSADTTHTNIALHNNRAAADLQAYPNPFTEYLNIKVEIKEQGFYTLSVYNLSGQLQKIIYNDNLNKGNYTFSWSGRNWQNKELSESLYFIIMQGKNQKSVIKVIKR